MLYDVKIAEELKKAIESVEIKASEDDKEYMFDVVATTEDQDRDGEVIKVKGWDTKNWMNNPVILANHQYTIETIIWKGLKFYTSKWVKRLKWVFSKSNPLWELAKNLYQEWMLKTVSVWFMVKERNQNDPLIIEKAELLEVSFVAVPANPQALSLDWKLLKKWVEAGLIKEITDEKQEKTDKSEELEEITIKCILNEIKELRNDINTLKKSITDDKVIEEKETAEALEKKEVLQAVNRATAEALKNMKLLS